MSDGPRVPRLGQQRGAPSASPSLLVASTQARRHARAGGGPETLFVPAGGAVKGICLMGFWAPLAGLPEPLTPIQILWVALIMDGPLAVALALDATRLGII